jgi:hypothetical protein
MKKTDVIIGRASISCTAFVLKQEKNQPRIGANPPFGRIESDLRTLTFAIQLRCLAHPFIGTVRANPVAAPAPIIDLPLDLIS